MLVLRTGSLWPALLVHVANNLIGVALFLLRPSALEGTSSWPTILAWAVLGTAGLLILLSRQVRGRIRGLAASP